MGVKIAIKDNDPYNSVAEKVVRLSGNGMDAFVVRLRTSELGECVTIMVPVDMWYKFDYDWYEGGDVELLGFIRVQDIKLPELIK